MKINCPNVLFFIFLAFFVGKTGRGIAEPPIEREVDDGVPFLLSREKDALLALLPQLQESQESLALRSLGPVGFISLNRQSRAFRGKIIELNGRLLQTRQISNDFNGQNGSNTLFESWLLLDDEKKIPVRLLSLQVPPEIQVQEDKNNEHDKDSKNEQDTQKALNKKNKEYSKTRIQALACYYRLTSYTDGEDFYNTPTLIALNFSLTDSTKNTLSTLAKQKPEQFTPPTKESTAEGMESEELTSAETIPLETTPVEMSPTELQEILLHRFREKGPLSLVLPSEKSDEFPTKETQPMAIFPFRGTLTQAEKCPLPEKGINATESDQVESEFFWRCTVLDSRTNRSLVIDTPRIPIFQIKPNLLTSKELQQHTTSKSTSKPTVGGLAVFIGWQDEEKGLPRFVSPTLAWYPDTFLGELGFDVASLDAVPVYSPSALREAAVPTSQPDEETAHRAILQSVRLNAADRYPFYELLNAIHNAAPGKLTLEAEKNPGHDVYTRSYPAVELFNRPELHQGEVVLLQGIVRRTVLVLISDPEVRERYGLDRYYQLYLYTADSQGNPLVVCIPELPEGMTTGSDEHYRVPVTLAGVFYKTWAYRAASGVSGTEDSATESGEVPRENSEEKAEKEPDEKRWVRVPLLLGRDVQIIPEVEPGEKFPFSMPVFWTFFWVLVLLYCVYRLVRRSWSR